MRSRKAVFASRNTTYRHRTWKGIRHLAAFERYLQSARIEKRDNEIRHARSCTAISPFLPLLSLVCFINLREIAARDSVEPPGFIIRLCLLASNATRDSNIRRADYFGGNTLRLPISPGFISDIIASITARAILSVQPNEIVHHTRNTRSCPTFESSFAKVGVKLQPHFQNCAILVTLRN